MNKSSILAVQFALGLIIDGSYGQKTKDAVITFQKANGLVPDGIVGSKTLAAINQKVVEKEKKPVSEALLFSHLRVALFKSFTQSQVDGIKSKLAVIADLPVTYQAYILATSYHETDKAMQPIAEYGQGRNYRYGRWFDLNGEKVCYRNSIKKTYKKSEYNYLYYGRGDVQLTWLDNYIKAGKILGVDLANNPDFALKPDISAKIMREGMLNGWFTGHKLDRYMGYSWADYVGARKIINGVDKSSMIANYALIFEEALRIAKS